jgi:tight adherence protein C
MILTLASILLSLALITAASYLVYTGVNGVLAQNTRFARRMHGELRVSRADSENLRADRLVPDEGVRDSLERILTPKDEKTLSRIRKQLIRAGYRDTSAVRAYYFWKWTIALGGLIVSSIVFAALMARGNPIFPIAGTCVVVILCFFAADMWLQRKAVYRRMDIERSFPDALDLILVCIEAGHGLDQALNRVATEMKKSAPVLSAEVALIVAELRAGKVRDKVLSDFAERIGLQDVNAFVTVMKQAQQFGVSIADTLRVYSKEMRNKRFMRAEEKANMMPIQLALGAIAFTIPPVIVILIGPSVVLILREMAKATVIG